MNPKLSVHKVIEKSMILWSIKTTAKTRIYYAWELKKRTKQLSYPCIIVDYDKKKREWYVNYVYENGDMEACTIDDITGQYSIIEKD